MLKRDKIIGGLWGAVVGDSLGVPVEFHSRAERKKDPVTGMRGEGTFNLPPGSWSDDSSLMLCTVEGLLDGFNTGNIGRLFVRWLKDGYWTPFGYAFDVGYTTAKSIKKMEEGVEPELAGGMDERDNGNGSLMRILPVALYFASSSPSEIVGYAQQASSLTHRHPRSLMACGFYCLVAVQLLKGANPQDAYLYAIKQFKGHYAKCPYAYELSHFECILSGAIASLPERKIKSSGYVIHTLEASLWCLLTTNSFPEAVLKAINLGDDTDTTGIVTGGLAGIYYGFDTIPHEWLDVIARKDDITGLFEKYLAYMR